MISPREVGYIAVAVLAFTLFAIWMQSIFAPLL